MNPFRKPKAILFFALSLMVIGEGSVVLMGIVNNGALPRPPKECFSVEKEYNKWTCFKPYFEELTSKASAVYAMNEAKRLKDEGVLDDCHLTAHYIGEANLAKHNFDAGQAFATCDFGCIEGCFHGVMEGYVRSDPDPSAVLERIGSMCKNVAPDDRTKKAVLLRGQCAHGLGHGLVAHGFVSIPQALEACQSIGDGHYARRCGGGVAMEHVEQYLGLDGNDLKEALPEICAPFEGLDDEGAVFRCIENIGVGLMFYTKHDLPRSKELCEELQKPLYIATCKSGAEEAEVINLTG